MTITASSFIKLPGIAEPMAIRDFMRVEGYGNYSRIYCQGRSFPLIITHSLKWFEAHLPLFLRTNKSQLINPDYIIRTHYDNARLLLIDMADSSQVVVSRRRIDYILKELSGRNA